MQNFMWCLSFLISPVYGRCCTVISDYCLQQASKFSVLQLIMACDTHILDVTDTN
jgi:hypothetical protein